MAKRVYIGVNDKARRVKKIYTGINNVARKVKKIYVGVGNIARLCYTAFVNVTYTSKKTLSFSTKEVEPGTVYGTFPTLPAPPAKVDGAGGRVDFWFDPKATAKYDSSKKYIDYPWCAYADANPDLYSTYGYKKDLLASHWNTSGITANRALGGMTPTTICTNEEDHTLQHAYTAQSVLHHNLFTQQTLLWNNIICRVYDSNGTLLYTHDLNTLGRNWILYPGMKIVYYSHFHEGLLSGGQEAAWVKLDGVKKCGADESFTYIIPDNVYYIKMSANVTTIESKLGAQAVQITITTKTL